MIGLLSFCETKEEEDWHLEQQRQEYEAARDAEEMEQLKKRMAELETQDTLIRAILRLGPMHDPAKAVKVLYEDGRQAFDAIRGDER